MILEKIKSRFKRGGAARDVATLTIGTAIAQSVTIAVMPLLSRLYTPNEFGLLAVFLAVSSIGATLVTLRYETSILVPKKDSEAASLVLLCLMLALALAALMGFFSALLPIEYQRKVGLGILQHWLIVACLTAAVGAILAVLQGWLNRLKQYQQMAFLRIAQSVSLAGLAILFGLFSLNHGLLLAQVIASACICIVALWFGRSFLQVWNRQELRKAAYTHQNAPKYLLPTALLDVVTLQMPLILIATWFGEAMAGQFSMAWRLLMLPMTLIGGAMGQVFLERFARTVVDIHQSKELLKNTWKYLLLMGLAPMMFVLFFGDYIFLFFLGDKWVNAGSIAKILAPMALAMFVSSPTSGTFIVLGIQRFSPLFGMASLIYRPLSLFVGYYYGDIYCGLFLWVVCEIIQVIVYQVMAWKSINSRQI